MAAKALAALDGRMEELRAVRRDLHAHPELSRQETRTTSQLASHLASTACRVRPLAGTGLIAELGSPDPKRRIALRGDIDALPIQETSGLGFASETAGVCHACGHDVHATSVLGAAWALDAVAEELEAAGIAIRFIFQPAEEVQPGGALAVLEQGGMVGVDQIFALHCDPAKDVGTVGLRYGGLTSASDLMTVHLYGHGGHTSRPHLTSDVVMGLSKVISEVPLVLTRRLDPRSVASLVWGAVKAGGAPNVIPAHGEVAGSLRMLDVEQWDGAEEMIRGIVEEVIAPYDLTCSIDYVQGVPPVMNDPASVDAMDSAVRMAIGENAVVRTEQSMGGEDFGWLVRETPGAMARLGTRSPGGNTYDLHQGDLIIDERAVGYGARLLAASALKAAGLAGAVATSVEESGFSS